MCESSVWALAMLIGSKVKKRLFHCSKSDNKWNGKSLLGKWHGELSQQQCITIFGHQIAASLKFDVIATSLSWWSIRSTTQVAAAVREPASCRAFKGIESVSWSLCSTGTFWTLRHLFCSCERVRKREFLIDLIVFFNLLFCNTVFTSVGMQYLEK